MQNIYIYTCVFTILLEIIIRTFLTTHIQITNSIYTDYGIISYLNKNKKYMSYWINTDINKIFMRKYYNYGII